MIPIYFIPLSLMAFCDAHSGKIQKWLLLLFILSVIPYIHIYTISITTIIFIILNIVIWKKGIYKLADMLILIPLIGINYWILPLSIVLHIITKYGLKLKYNGFIPAILLSTVIIYGI